MEVFFIAINNIILINDVFFQLFKWNFNNCFIRFFFVYFHRNRYFHYFFNRDLKKLINRCFYDFLYWFFDHNFINFLFLDHSFNGNVDINIVRYVYYFCYRNGLFLYNFDNFGLLNSFYLRFVYF